MTHNRLDIFGGSRFDDQRFTRDRMDQLQPIGVKCLPFDQRRRIAVEVVAENRMTDGGEMDS